MRIILFALLFCVIAPITSKADERFLDIQEIQTQSGITTWFVEDHTLPIISLQFSFLNAGSKNENVDKQGTAKLLSNMLDEGAGEIKSQEFQKQLADHSISLSFSSSRDHFNGQVKTLSRNKDKAFALLKLALDTPRFDKEPLERMKAANISRIRSSLSDPDWIAARLQNELIYNGHPYAQNSGGTISTLEKVSADDLRSFKRQHLTKDRLVVSAAGDISAAELKTVIDDIFKDIADGKENSQTQSAPSPKTGIFVFEKDIPQTLIEITFPAFNRLDPDFYALQVFNYIYGGGGFGSRLMEEVREKQGLTYGIYSYSSLLDESQKFYISTSTQNDKAKTVLEILESEKNKITENFVSKEELENAKKYLVGSLPLSLTSTDKIASIALSLQKNNRSIDYLDLYKDKINAVSLEDVQRVAKRILKIENATTLLVGKPSDIDNFKVLKDIPNVE